LATPTPAKSIEVRWPGKEIVTLPVPAGAREIEIDSSGTLEVVPSRR
jgi:hypothetical protein